MEKILIVEDEKAAVPPLTKAASGPDREIRYAEDLDQAIDLIRKENFDVVITDLRLKKYNVEEGGLRVLEEALSREINTQVIVVTDYPSDQSVITAMTRGAFDYIDRNTLSVRYQDILPYKIAQALNYANLLRIT